MGVSSGSAGALRALQHRDFRFVALGWLVSLLGDGVFRVTIAVQVYAIDRDPRAFSAVAITWAFSQVLLLPVGGWAGDRFPRRTVVLLADLWRAAAIGALGVLSVTDRLTIPALLVIAFAFGSGNAFFNPTAASLIPDLVPSGDLARANAFLSAAKPTMLYIVGPLLGALFAVAGLELGTAFLVDAATFLASAALVALVAPRPAAVGAADKGFVAQFREAVQGLREAARVRWLWLGMLGAGMSGIAFQGPFESLVPFLLIEEFGLEETDALAGLAPILAGFGVGSIGTAWWIGRRDLPRRSALAYYWGEGTAMLMLVVLGLMSAPLQGVVAGVVIGAMFALTEIVWMTSLQRGVPRERLGRVMSLDWMVALGLTPLSFVLSAQLAAAFGPRTALVTAGLLGAAGLVGLGLVPGARDMDRFARTPGQPTPAAEDARVAAERR